MKIVFVRHTSVAVPVGVCYGQTDVELSSGFEEEAATVKQALDLYDFSRCYTSPSSRCKKLAAYCGFADAVSDSRLMEMDFGAWEMENFDEINDPRLQEWYADYINVAPTGGESSAQQKDRLRRFLLELLCDMDAKGDNGPVVIFTHGGILAHANAIAQGLSAEEAFSVKFPYGAIVESDISLQQL